MPFKDYTKLEIPLEMVRDCNGPLSKEDDGGDDIGDIWREAWLVDLELQQGLLALTGSMISTVLSIYARIHDKNFSLNIYVYNWNEHL